MQPLAVWSPGFSRSKTFEPPDRRRAEAALWRAAEAEGGTPNQPRFMQWRSIGAEAALVRDSPRGEGLRRVADS